MKLLIVLLFISSNSFAQYKKVKEVGGVRVSKGIIAQYDELENSYIITTDNFYMSEGFNGIYNHITLSYTYNNDNIKPFVELSIDTLQRKHIIKVEEFIDVNEIDIYIQNKGSKPQKYTVDWSNKTITKKEFQKYNNTAIREFTKIQDQDLFDFFLENIQQKSSITMRFKNTINNSIISVEVKKREIKDLFNMLELYKQLMKKPQ